MLLKISGGLIVLFIALVVCTHLFVSAITATPVSEMTLDKAQKLFEAVGGVGAVNREVKVLFNRSGTNDWQLLDAEDCTNLPAIQSLYLKCESYSGKKYGGTSMSIFPENGRHLSIKYGNHWSIKSIYIFDPDKVVTFNSPSNWFQINSNIFASK